jgi:flagellar hook assembly protein FlgD
MEITGKSIYAQFVRKNLNTLVEKKINILNKENGYIYLHKDGDFREGNNTMQGQNSVSAFGGYEKTKKKAIKNLQYLIDREPFEQESIELKKYF